MELVGKANMSEATKKNIFEKIGDWWYYDIQDHDIPITDKEKY